MFESQELIDIGNRIRERREFLHMSQDDLANETEIDKTTIHRIEHGKNEMRILNLKKIAVALHCSTDSLLTGVTDECGTSDVLALCQQLTALSPVAKEIWLSQARSLMENLSKLQ